MVPDDIVYNVIENSRIAKGYTCKNGNEYSIDSNIKSLVNNFLKKCKADLKKMEKKEKIHVDLYFYFENKFVHIKGLGTKRRDVTTCFVVFRNYYYRITYSGIAILNPMDKQDMIIGEKEALRNALKEGYASDDFVKLAWKYYLSKSKTLLRNYSDK